MVEMTVDVADKEQGKGNLQLGSGGSIRWRACKQMSTEFQNSNIKDTWLAMGEYRLPTGFSSIPVFFPLCFFLVWSLLPVHAVVIAGAYRFCWLKYTRVYNAMQDTAR